MGAQAGQAWFVTTRPARLRRLTLCLSRRRLPLLMFHLRNLQ